MRSDDICFVSNVVVSSARIAFQTVMVAMKRIISYVSTDNIDSVFTIPT